MGGNFLQLDKENKFLISDLYLVHTLKTSSFPSIWSEWVLWKVQEYPGKYPGERTSLSHFKQNQPCLRKHLEQPTSVKNGDLPSDYKQYNHYI